MRYIKCNQVFTAALAVLIVAFAVVAFAQQSGYFAFNGKSFTVKSGATQTIASGGVFNVASGGALKINGTQVTATGAQLNMLAGVTAGTTTASKALVVGATKDVDSLTFKYLKATQQVQPVASGLATACTLYAAGSFRGSGTTFIGRPLAAKSTVLLQTGATIGAYADFQVADTDTLRIRAASGDSLIFGDGSADIVAGSVAGSCRVIYGLANKWFIVNQVGTWTASHN